MARGAEPAGERRPCGQCAAAGAAGAPLALLPGADERDGGARGPAEAAARCCPRVGGSGEAAAAPKRGVSRWQLRLESDVGLLHGSE